MVAVDFPKDHEDILHDDAHPNLNRIVAMGVDESENSDHALEWCIVI